MRVPLQLVLVIENGRDAPEVLWASLDEPKSREGVNGMVVLGEVQNDGYL